MFIVDAFTSKPFAGNPAAVCVLKQFPDPSVMQKIAAEMNLSETAFVCPSVIAQVFLLLILFLISELTQKRILKQHRPFS